MNGDHADAVHPVSPSRSDGVPPAIALQRLLAGTWISSAISVAARLGIADLLADGAKTTSDLVAATGSHEPSLARLLRTLSSVGIFHMTDDGRVALTRFAEPLQADVPARCGPSRSCSARNGSGAPGAPSAQHPDRRVRLRASVWDDRLQVLDEHPEAGAIFDAAMTSRSADENQAVLSAFDFARFTTLADIGGGHGSLLTAILERYPILQGLLFDLPHVVAGAVDDLSQQASPSAVRSWVVTSSRQ